MKLVFRGHDDRYAVEQSLLAFFPEERPVYQEPEPGEDNWARVDLHQGPVYATAVTEIAHGGRLGRGTSRALLREVTDEYERERLRQKAVKLSFFKAARSITGLTPAWGALTGIRPGKLAARLLEQGKTPAQVSRILGDTYYVSPSRRRLAVETAQEGLRAKADLRPEDISLYIGIPFCPTRCAYCSFVSQSVEKSLGLMEPYLEVLCREITDAAQMVRETGLRIKSFYMGGGTPTTLSARQMDRLLTHLNRSFDLSGCVEYCIEAGRPDTITREKLQVLLDHGADRISVNPQSLEDEVLRAIGRRHTARDIREAFCTAREVDFACINMDLIAGLPQDSVEGFRDSLEEVLALRPENITVHTLAMKKGSRLMEEGGALPSGEETGRMVDLSLEALEGAGYRPYYLYRQKYMSGGLENVSWCLPGTENHYNIIMMEELQSVLSLGAGGVTKLVDRSSRRIVRLTNPKYPHDYLAMSAKVLEQKDEILRFYREV